MSTSFGFCDRDTMHTWAAALEADLRSWLASLLDMPLQTPHAIIGLSTPVSLGGLGFLNPQHEAALRFLQAVLPSVEELPIAEDDRNPVGQMIARCLDYLDHQAGKPLRPLIEHLAPHRMGR